MNSAAQATYISIVDSQDVLCTFVHQSLAENRPEAPIKPFNRHAMRVSRAPLAGVPSRTELQSFINKKTHQLMLELYQRKGGSGTRRQHYHASSAAGCNPNVAPEHLLLLPQRRRCCCCCRWLSSDTYLSAAAAVVTAAGASGSVW